MLNGLDFALAVIGLLLVLTGFFLWRSAGYQRRLSKQEPLQEIQKEIASRARSPEGMIQEMEVRLYHYGREVEGRVETTLNVLDRLILEAEQEIGRLEELLQQQQPNARRVEKTDPEIEQKIALLITAGLENAPISECLNCSLELVQQVRNNNIGSNSDRHAA